MKLSSIELVKVAGRTQLLVIREKQIAERCECEYCSRHLEAGEGVFVGQMIIGTERHDLDGVYCTEDCVLQEAKATRIVETTNHSKGDCHVTATSH